MSASYTTLVDGDKVTFPKVGDTISLNYIGRFENGTEFDNSYLPGRTPFITQVGVGSVIQAWEEVLPLLSLGQRVRIVAPPEKAYGANGFPPIIPANSTLVFELQLISVC